MFKKDNTKEIVQIVAESFERITTNFMIQLADVEKKHWEQLEKQSSKQLQILEKQTKDFIGVMTEFIEASKPPVAPPPLVADMTILDKVMERENTIEKEEKDENFLDEIQRIPMTGNNINVQFDGEEQIHPINIS